MIRLFGTNKCTKVAKDLQNLHRDSAQCVFIDVILRIFELQKNHSFVRNVIFIPYTIILSEYDRNIWHFTCCYNRNAPTLEY